MTRIYSNRSLVTRMNISCVVIVIAVLFGFWELWTATRGGPGQSTNMLFGFLFIAGAIYGARQLQDSSFDNVIAFDADMTSGQATVDLWRPFSKKTLVAPLDKMTDWQFQLKGTRVKTPILTAYHPGYPRPLEFELSKATTPLSDELKKLAPEAVAAFERALAR